MSKFFPLCVLVSFQLGLLNLSAAYAAPQWRTTHFARCFTDDSVMKAGGAWWYWEMTPRGLNDGVRYGGSYLTVTKQISASDYGSRKPDSLYTVTGLMLKQSGGSWIDRFYLPIEYSEEICGT